MSALQNTCLDRRDPAGSSAAPSAAGETRAKRQPIRQGVPGRTRVPAPKHLQMFTEITTSRGSAFLTERSSGGREGARSGFERFGCSLLF